MSGTYYYFSAFIDVEEYGTILRKRDAAYGANEMDKRRGIVETETHGKSTDASNNTIFSGSNRYF